MAATAAAKAAGAPTLKRVGFMRIEHERAVPTLAQEYTRHAENYTRAAEQTDDLVFRNMLLSLALLWRLAAQPFTGTFAARKA